MQKMNVTKARHEVDLNFELSETLSHVPSSKFELREFQFYVTEVLFDLSKVNSIMPEPH